MPPNDIRKLRRLIRFLMVLVIIFIALVSAALIHSFIDPGTKSFPSVISREGPAGPPGQIDYERLSDTVRDQLSQLDQPAQGPQGIAGAAGRDGAAGKDGSDGLDGAPGKDGSDGKDGTNGIDGVSLLGRTPEFRANPITGDIEWRYVGDRLWTVLLAKCSLLVNCELP